MNATNQSILGFIEYFCRHEGALHYATLIKGKWGSGKTFLIRRFFEKHSDIPTIYVSLYGMKEVADIEDAFFAQARHRALTVQTDVIVADEAAGIVELDGDALASEVAMPNGQRAGDRFLPTGQFKLRHVTDVEIETGILHIEQDNGEHVFDNMEPMSAVRKFGFDLGPAVGVADLKERARHGRTAHQSSRPLASVGSKRVPLAQSFPKSTSR